VVLVFNASWAVLHSAYVSVTRIRASAKRSLAPMSFASISVANKCFVREVLQGSPPWVRTFPPSCFLFTNDIATLNGEIVNQSCQQKRIVSTFNCAPIRHAFNSYKFCPIWVVFLAG
jgi:hypothetical protein